jgi:antitoxin MazE
MMRVLVRKLGNSPAVRIPAAIMAAASLHSDQTVDVQEENGCIVIEPVKARAYD